VGEEPQQGFCIVDLASAFALIEELPNAGESVRHPRIASLRRVLLGRVQYHLYYVVLRHDFR
jgi:hypothetical protein